MFEILFALFNLSIFTFTFVRSKFDFLYPPVLYFGTWGVASFGYALMSLYWGVLLHFNTFLILIGAGVMFLLGSECVSWHLKLITVRSVKLRGIKLNMFYLNILSIFEIFMFAYVYHHQWKLATSVNETIIKFDVVRILEYARYATVHGGYSNTRLFVNIVRIIYVLALILFYDYLSNKRKKIKYRAYYELVQCIFLPIITIFTANRMHFLGILSGYVIIYLGLYQKYYGKMPKKQVIKVLKYLIIITILFISFFGILNATLLARTQNKSFISIFRYTMKYVSSAIPALDYFINNRAEFGMSYFGASTFHSVYVFLHAIGLVKDEVFQTFLPFTPVASHEFTTNVYTMYFQYIYDFGILGIVFPFVNGAFYGYLYKCIKGTKKSPTAILFYAVMALPLMVSFFAEQLWTMINSHLVRIMIMIIMLVFIDEN